MSYNLGTNIGAVENGNPTGQVYSTKIVRTGRSIGFCGNTGSISTYGCILSRLNNNNYTGYATFNIVSPFALGTKPKHLTINKVEILTSQLTFKSTPVSVGILIIPNTPSGYYDQTGNILNTDNTKKLAFITSDSFVQFNSTYVCSNTLVNQVVADLSSSGIENDILTLNLCLINLNAAAISLTDGAVFNISIDYSFE
jgi:hypothetical protein